IVLLMAANQVQTRETDMKVIRQSLSEHERIRIGLPVEGTRRRLELACSVSISWADSFWIANPINRAARASAADRDVQVAGLRMHNPRGRCKAIVSNRLEKALLVTSVR